MAAPSADRINARARKDRAFLKRALKNPGLRAKLDPKYLSGPQKQQRALNTRLNAPITPGSSTTERDLAHSAGAATDVRYGPQERDLAQNLGVAQTTERDTGSFYDQYLANLDAHRARVEGYQAGAQANLAATAAGITGLSGAQGAELQAQSNQAAAQQGVAPAANLGPMASDAAAVRQALIGSFQGMQASQGAAANTYADTQARVVGPGQKLSAQAQAAGRTRDVRKQISGLKAEEGAYNQSFRDTRRQDEFKNVLATQTLGLNTAKAATDAASKAAASDPTVAAAKTSATASATQAAKYGYTAHQWALLGPTARNKIINAAKSKGNGGSDTVYTGGAFAGRKKSDVAAMSDAERQRIVKDYNAGKGKPKTTETTSKEEFRRKYGVDLQATSQHNTARDAVQNAQTAFGQVGKVTARKDGSKKRVTTDEVVSVLRGQGVSNVLIRAALDISRYGHITPGTANRLHRAGYSVGTLGYRTGPPTRRGSTSNRTTRPGSGNANARA